MFPERIDSLRSIYSCDRVERFSIVNVYKSRKTHSLNAILLTFIVIEYKSVPSSTRELLIAEVLTQMETKRHLPPPIRRHQKSRASKMRHILPDAEPRDQILGKIILPCLIQDAKIEVETVWILYKPKIRGAQDWSICYIYD